MQTKTLKWMAGVGCGVLLGATVVWACDLPTRNLSLCSDVTQCAAVNPVVFGTGWTCADANSVESIIKTCGSGNGVPPDSCDDGAVVHCYKSSGCNLITHTDNSTQPPTITRTCGAGLVYGDWHWAAPKVKGVNCH